ncbi:hypothetical protein [Kordiimonas sp. SCSIO 12610]|uniref:hypothetical protein n=1 Tax=Kordiimonas sp. SCSIO 12610 TaxID=2829597 RepID=UPI00210A0582|nr:hypothetical protein [Kordiimonas sp. SCSIO 12610]UTW54611.1 hypothetical protein KFF44_12475 [Kordiimonas sp. SCSIO 12610]
MNPMYSKLKFFKITIIPSEWSEQLIAEFWELIEKISQGNITPHVLEYEANLLRLDYAIDFIGAPTQDFYINKPKSKTKKNSTKRKGNIYIGNEGNMETYYLAPSTNKEIKERSAAYIYDKKAKNIFDKKPEKCKGADYTRFELVFVRNKLKKKQIFNLINFAPNSVNYFKRYDIIDFRAFNVENHGKEYKQENWLVFGDASKLRRIENALEIFPSSTQKVYKMGLSYSRLRSWQFKRLWNDKSKNLNKILGK